jgi:hypothetical protein
MRAAPHTQPKKSDPRVLHHKPAGEKRIQGGRTTIPARENRSKEVTPFTKLNKKEPQRKIQTKRMFGGKTMMRE